MQHFSKAFVTVVTMVNHKKKKSLLNTREHILQSFILLFLTYSIQAFGIMSYSSNIPTWTEENRTLHDTICQARVNKDSAVALRQILYINKERFLMLLDSEPKNAHHRSMLNSSTYLDRNVM